MKSMDTTAAAIVLASSLLLATSCAAPIAAEEQSSSGAGAAVELWRLSEDTYLGGLPEEIALVVRDEASWRTLWDRMVQGIHPHPATPAADFDREMLLVAGMGRQPTGGYWIRIERVADIGNSLVASVLRTSPGPSCGVTMAQSRPTDIVRLRRSEKPVRWSIRDRVQQC